MSKWGRSAGSLTPRPYIKRRMLPDSMSFGYMHYEQNTPSDSQHKAYWLISPFDGTGTACSILNTINHTEAFKILNWFVL